MEKHGGLKIKHHFTRFARFPFFLFLQKALRDGKFDGCARRYK
jgi:hypothetical protein